METWADVAGYEGLYQVSVSGNVRRVGSREPLKPTATADGYRRVSLCKNGVQAKALVHRLVAQAFIPNKDGKQEVNHINGDKTDNRAENLEWVTHAENIAHACRIGLRDNARYRELARENGRKASKAVMRSDGAVFGSIREAARAAGVSDTAVWNVANGRRPSAGGYSYEYVR